MHTLKVRRAVQVFCPLDPEFKGFHVETFAVDPRSQYDLTVSISFKSDVTFSGLLSKVFLTRRLKLTLRIARMDAFL